MASPPRHGIVHHRDTKKNQEDNHKDTRHQEDTGLARNGTKVFVPFLARVSLCLGGSADLGVHIQVEHIGQTYQIIEDTDDVSGQIDVIIREGRLAQFFQILVDDLRGG